MSDHRGKLAHNFALRYPMPFREVFTEYAKAYELDESWILGIVRQESRFITDARSAAGAAGLMQVMPRTARFVAQKIGLRNYLRKGVTEVETNITLGTGYLRLVLGTRFFRFTCARLRSAQVASSFSSWTGSRCCVPRVA